MTANEFYSFGEQGQYNIRGQSQGGQYGEQEQGRYVQGSLRQERYPPAYQREEQNRQGYLREEQYGQGSHREYGRASHREEQYGQASRGFQRSQAQGLQFDQEGEGGFLSAIGGGRTRLLGGRRRVRRCGPLSAIRGAVVEAISGNKVEEKYRDRKSYKNNQNNYGSHAQGYGRC